jgi:hypothetical protein
VDTISQAHRTRLFRLGPFSLLAYRLFPGQFHPRRKLRLRFHLQWGPRCVEMAL